MNEQLLNEVVNSQTAGVPVVKADVLPKNIKPVETQPTSQPVVPTPTPVLEGGEDKIVQSKPAQQTQSFQINEEIARPLYEQANKYARNIQGLQKDLDYDKFVSKYLSSPEAASSYYKGILNISREVPLKVAIGGSQDFLKKLYITPEAEAAAVNNVAPQNNLSTIKQQADKKIEEVNGKYGINEQAAKIANNQPLNPIEGFGYSVGLDPLATREQAIIEGGTEALHKGKSEQFQKENPIPKFLQAPAKGGGVEDQLKQKDEATQKMMDDLTLKTYSEKMVNPLAEGDFAAMTKKEYLPNQGIFIPDYRQGWEKVAEDEKKWMADMAAATQFTEEDRAKYGGGQLYKLEKPESDTPIFDWKQNLQPGASSTDYWITASDNYNLIPTAKVDAFQNWGRMRVPVTFEKVMDDYTKYLNTTNPELAKTLIDIRGIEDEKRRLGYDMKDYSADKSGVAIGFDLIKESLGLKDESQQILKLAKKKNIFSEDFNANMVSGAFNHQKAIIIGEYRKGNITKENADKALATIEKTRLKTLEMNPKIKESLRKQEVARLDAEAYQEYADMKESAFRENNPYLASFYYDYGGLGFKEGAKSILNDFAQTVDMIAGGPSLTTQDMYKAAEAEVLPTSLQGDIWGTDGFSAAKLFNRTASTLTQMVGLVGGSGMVGKLGKLAKTASGIEKTAIGEYALAKYAPQIAKGEDLTKMIVTAYGQTRDDFYESALSPLLNAGYSREVAEDMADSYANRSAAVMAGLETLVPIPFLNKIKTGIKDDFAALLKSGENGYMATAKAIGNSTKDFGVEVGKQFGEEFLQEAGDKANNAIFNKSAGMDLLDTDMTLNGVGELLMITAASTLGMGIGTGNIYNSPVSKKATIWLATQDIAKFEETVDTYVKDGKLEKQQGESMKEGVRQVSSAMNGLPQIKKLTDRQKLDLGLLIYEKKKLDEEVKSGYVDELFREQKEAEINKKKEKLNKEILNIYNLNEDRSKLIAETEKLEKQKKEADKFAAQELAKRKIETINRVRTQTEDLQQEEETITKIEGKKRPISAVNDVTGQTGFKTGKELVPESTVVADIPKKDAISVTKVFEQKPVVNKPEFKDEASRQKFAEDNQGNIVTETVSVADIIPTQTKLDKTNTGGEGKPLLVRTNEGLFVLDGHHTIANQIKNGTKEVDADIIDLTTKTETNDTKNKTGLPSEVGVGQESVQAQPIEKTGTEATTTSGNVQASEKVTEVKEETTVDALKDVESTAKALEGKNTSQLEASLLPQIAGDRIIGKSPNETIAEAYHKAKKDGSNPELVKAVEDLLGKPKATETTPQAKAEPVTKQSKADEKINKAKETVSNESTSKATRNTAVKTLFSTPQTKGKTTTFETWKNDAKGKKQLAEAKKALGMKASTAATPVELYNAAMAKGKTAQEFTDAVDVAMGRKEAVKEDKSAVRKALENIANAKYLGNDKAFGFIIPGTKQVINIGIGTVKLMANSIIKAMDKFADIKGNIDYNKAGNAAVNEMKATDWYKNLNPKQKNAINTHIKSMDPFAAIVDITEMAAKDKKTTTEKIIKTEEKALETKIVTDLTKEITQEEKQAIKDKAKEKAFEAKIATDLTKEMTKDEKQAIKDKAKSDKEIARAKAKEEKQKLRDKNKAIREKAKAEKEEQITKSIGATAKQRKQAKSEERKMSAEQKVLKEKTVKGEKKIFYGKDTSQKERDNAIKRGNNLRSRIKTRAKNARKNKKTLGVAEIDIMESFAALDPALIFEMGGKDAIDQYNEMARQIIIATTSMSFEQGTTKLKPTERTLSNEDVKTFVEKMDKLYETYQFNILKSKNQGLIEVAQSMKDSSTGKMLLGENFTFEELNAFLDKFNVGDRKIVETINDAMSPNKIKEMQLAVDADLKRLIDANEKGKFNGLDKSRKRVIDNIMKLSTENLTPDQLIRANYVINNIIANQRLDGAGHVEAVAISQQAAIKIIEIFDKYEVKGLRQFKNGLASTEFMTLPAIRNAMAKNQDLAAEIGEVLKQAELGKGYADVMEGIKENWSTKIENLKKTYGKDIVKNPENRLRQGMYAIIIQWQGKTDLDKQEWFEDNKRLLEEDIKYKKSSKDENIREEGKLEEKIFNKVFKNAKTMEEASKAMNAYMGDKKMVELANNVFSKNLDKFKFSSEVYGNQDFDEWNNYSHRKWKESNEDNKWVEFDDNLQNNKNMGLSVFDKNVNKKTAASSIDRTSIRPKKTKVLNLDFFTVQDKAIHDSYYQANTLGTRYAIKEIFENEAIIDAIGVKNMQILRQRTLEAINHQMGVTQLQQELSKGFNKVLNFFIRSKSAGALGGPGSLLKQSVGGLTGALIRNPRTGYKAFKYVFANPNSNLFSESNLRSRMGAIFEGNIESMKDLSDPLFKGYTKKFFNNIDELNKNTVEGKNLVGKVVGLRPLQYADYHAAKGAWMTYYEKKWKQNNKGKKFSWAEQENNPDKSASTYADHMVETTMNVNDVSNAGNYFRNNKAYNKVFRTIFSPFASFAVNQDFRILNALRNITSLDLDGKKRMQGFAEISSVLGEQIAFNYTKMALSTAISYMVANAIAASGGDDEEARKKADKMYEELPFQKDAIIGLRKVTANTLFDATPLGVIAPPIMSVAEYLGKTYLNDYLTNSKYWKQIFGDDPAQIFPMKGYNMFGNDTNFDVPTQAAITLDAFGMMGEAVHEFINFGQKFNVAFLGGYKDKNGNQVELTQSQKNRLYGLMMNDLIGYGTGFRSQEWGRIVKGVDFNLQKEIKKQAKKQANGKKKASSDNIGLGNMGLDMNLDLDLDM